MENKPIIEPKQKKEVYVLEDKDFLLIEAIKDLTKAIKVLNIKLR